MEKYKMEISITNTTMYFQRKRFSYSIANRTISRDILKGNW